MTYRSSKSVHFCALGASRRIKQKIKNLKKVYLSNHNTCFSRVRPDHPRCRSATWICMCGYTRDMVIYSKFHRNSFRGFETPVGQNLALPITLASRFYNSLCYRTNRKNERIKISPTHQISLISKKLFVDARTDVRTGGRTFETHFIRSTRRSRPNETTI